jgi:hypothetical protein
VFIAVNAESSPFGKPLAARITKSEKVLVNDLREDSDFQWMLGGGAPANTSSAHSRIWKKP